MFATLHAAAERKTREREVAQAQAFGMHFSEIRWQRPPRRTLPRPAGLATVTALASYRPTPTPPPAAA